MLAKPPLATTFNRLATCPRNRGRLALFSSRWSRCKNRILRQAPIRQRQVKAGPSGGGSEADGVSTTQLTGEWDGVMVVYNADGTPRQLPHHLVPPAYADWGITVYDWQVQWSCPTSGPPYTPQFRRLMPTVGCELEAVAFDTENYTLFAKIPVEFSAGTDKDQVASVLLGDGSFVDVRVEGKQGESAGRGIVEVAFVMRGPGGSSQPQRCRVQMLFTVKDGAWVIDEVSNIKEARVAYEKYDRQHDGLLDLFVMSGRHPDISNREKLNAEQLLGSWRATMGQLRDFRLDGTVENMEHVVCFVDGDVVKECVELCMGVWFRVFSTLSGAVMLEVGKLREDGARQVAQVGISQEGKVATVGLSTQEKRAKSTVRE